MGKKKRKVPKAQQESPQAQDQTTSQDKGSRPAPFTVVQLLHPDDPDQGRSSFLAQQEILANFLAREAVKFLSKFHLSVDDFDDEEFASFTKAFMRYALRYPLSELTQDVLVDLRSVLEPVLKRKLEVLKQEESKRRHGG
jgi:hypothetical protein